MKMKVPISYSALRVGLIYWPVSVNSQALKLFSGLDYAHVVFCGTPLGDRRISLKSRRISVGKKHYQFVVDRKFTIYNLHRKGNVLFVTCTRE